MPRRNSFKKTKTNYLDDAAIEYEDTLWDADIQELRWNQWMEQIRREQTRQTEAALARWEQYFFTDGSCRAHDHIGCRECRHYAAGRCPSYWEEY